MNANDTLNHHKCSEQLFRHSFGLIYTEGVQALCESYKCYWFLDVIASYQPELKGEEFQVWKLIRKEDNTAKVVCENGNDKVLKEQHIEFTDFEPTEATVWVEFGTALLPSEH